MLYEPSENFRKDIENRFTYHAPSPDQIKRYEKIRYMALGWALSLIESCPESRELSLALTHLDQAVMYANAAIARHEKPKIDVLERGNPSGMKYSELGVP